MARDSSEREHISLPDLPRMGLSGADNAAWVQAVTDRYCAGEISTDAYKALMTGSSKNATAVKIDRDANELQEIRELLAQAEKQRLDADEREKAIQQGRAPSH